MITIKQWLAIRRMLKHATIDIVPFPEGSNPDLSAWQTDEWIPFEDPKTSEFKTLQIGMEPQISDTVYDCIKIYDYKMRWYNVLLKDPAYLCKNSRMLKRKPIYEHRKADK